MVRRESSETETHKECNDEQLSREKDTIYSQDTSSLHQSAYN